MSAPTVDLGSMHGGLRLPAQKHSATSQPILEVPLPDRLVVPLEQHVGAAAAPTVACGEKVLRGQVIAAAGDVVGVPVHAPTSVGNPPLGTSRCTISCTSWSSAPDG